MTIETDRQYWQAPPATAGRTVPAGEVDGHSGQAGHDGHDGLPPAGAVNRRGFLKAAGFTLGAAAAAAGCRPAPVQYARAPLTDAENIQAGKSLWYASVCAGCEAGCGVLIKCRDGRPIKVEGNPDHPVSRGGLCAVGQAALLGVYDARRLSQPLHKGAPVAWDEAEAGIRTALDTVRRENRPVRVLSRTLLSPALRRQIEEFTAQFLDARHLVWDPLSNAAILDAHAVTHGRRVLPWYRFDRAELIVSFDADFLGTWISPVEYTAGYRAQRELNADPPRLSRHVQFEARMSLTGANADERRRLTPEAIGPALAQLARHVMARSEADGVGALTSIPPDTVPGAPDELLAGLAGELWKTRGRSLVVCGSTDPAVQELCNHVNAVLNNYGATLDLSQPSNQAQGDDRAAAELCEEIKAGQIGALILLDVNPVHGLPPAALEGFERNPPLLTVSLSEREDETTTAADYVCPIHHAFEGWSDAEPRDGLVSVQQPVLRPFGATRSPLELFAVWAGRPASNHDLVQQHWRDHVYPRRMNRALPFQEFWDLALHDGFAEVRPRNVMPLEYQPAALTGAPRMPEMPPESYALVAYPKLGIRDGRHASNPWLQELPDPVSKVAWDNYAAFSVAAAQRLGLTDGDVVRLVADEGGPAIELPAFVQPGQDDRTVAVALGYGSVATARFADAGPEWIQARPTVGADGLVGKNIAPLLPFDSERGALLVRSGVRVEKTGARHPLASTQEHHALDVPGHLAPADKRRRPLIQEAAWAAWRKDPSAGHLPHHHPNEGELYPPDHPYDAHHWGMVIDLSACTGCSACVVACQAENNIPVVGKDEVRRNRDMHWIRVDRYYAGEGDDVDVAHQPMMCQHCDQAPCEGVCPVLATVHTDEGLNAQVYNRCVGTRYCANNCPYKARRFNWFNYRRDNARENLVLNPDVTVRTRGVMEKCSFCVQRIQEARMEARRGGEPLRGSDIQPACQQSCPAQAIVFGDTNEVESTIAQLRAGPRHYHVLEELGVKPSVGYLTLVRHRENPEGDAHHG